MRCFKWINFITMKLLSPKEKVFKKKKNSQYFYNIKKIKVYKISTINGSKSRVVTQRKDPKGTVYCWARNTNIKSTTF